MNTRAVPLGSLAGGVVAAVASAAASLCCIGPLALTLLGVNGMILAAGIKPYRWYLLVISLGLLALAFWGTYRPKRSLNGSACPTRAGRVTRLVLWIATAVWLSATAVQFIVPGFGL